MPKRTDIRNILIIGSGPIVIGQACEFDYSGTQACKALREEGYRVVLINSNPATIMTDPELADRTYIEPITPEFIEKILIHERAAGHPIQALLPTLGGQTGLNCAMDAAERGILQRYDVTMIGATAKAIHLAEERTAFKSTMQRIGVDIPRSGVARSLEEARRVIGEVGLPCCIRPAYTLGGSGGGFGRTREQFERQARIGLEYSRVHEILIEEDLTGWKEFELEVMRDRADNVIIVCSIENVDPMGVHTGDSITVAPIQTLTDKEYQKMRDSAIAIIRAIGVDTGGCNIQFAVDPGTGRQVAIEMNPRVSRSSALASKATGYPIARIAAKLAVGYTLDELTNDITGTTPASFEPVLDYVVVKMPRWSFEKFPDCDETLTTQMKSVGEAMAIGRTFKEAFQKCIRSMEIKRFGYGLDGNDAWAEAMDADKNRFLAGAARHERGEEGGTARRPRRTAANASEGEVLGGTTATEAPPDTQEEHVTEWPVPDEVLIEKLSIPCQGRPYYIRYAFRKGWPLERVQELTRIDPWFLAQMKDLVDFEGDRLPHERAGEAAFIEEAHLRGYSEVQLSRLLKLSGGDKIVPDGCGQLPNYNDKLLGRAREGAVPYPSVASPPPAGEEKNRFLAGAARYEKRGEGAAAASTLTYKLVDTCAAEFEARTPYYYSAHERSVGQVSQKDDQASLKGAARVDDEIRVTPRPKIVILGGGPNRIGQGIEFDYCCCHASFAARAAGYESVMINSNPETVSTDFDTSDMLFFEPLTHEDVLNVIQRLNSCEPRTPLRAELGAQDISPTSKDSPKSKSKTDRSGCVAGPNSKFEVLRGVKFAARQEKNKDLVKGVIVQFGGQTPLNLAMGLKKAGVPIIGTQPEMIHAAEDRDQFKNVLRDLSLLQPPNGIAQTRKEAIEIARAIGYPILVRPSYVLGGRGMRVCNNDEDLAAFFRDARLATDRTSDEKHPVLIDKFLADAIEVDVDAVADYGEGVADPERRRAGKAPMCMVAGVMEHIEEAGIHSGDSTCVLPPFSLGRMVTEEIFRSTQRLAERLQVCGAMNVQYAVQNRTVYVLEVNPRAARTLPFVAKATGIPWARIATRVMLGEALADVLDEHRVGETPWPRHTSVKAPVFPFEKFPGVDVILGPEMRSTGEAMAMSSTFGRAFAKAQIAVGLPLPLSGNVLISVNDPDKPRILSVARELHDLGFKIYSTVGTRHFLMEAGIPAELVSKSAEIGRESKAEPGAKPSSSSARLPAQGTTCTADPANGASPPLPQRAPFLKDLIEDGTLNLLINTPIRTGPASDEGRWRAAAALHHVPLITTTAGARAAAAAIRAMKKGENGQAAHQLTVRPLQEYFE